MKHVIIFNLIVATLIVSSCSKVESNEAMFSKHSAQDLLNVFKTKTDGSLLFSALTLPNQSAIYYGFIGTIRDNQANIDGGKLSIGQYSFSPQSYKAVDNVYTSGELSTSLMSDLYNSQSLDVSLQKGEQTVFKDQISNIPSPIKITSISSNERPVKLKTKEGAITWETSNSNSLPVAIMLESRHNGETKKDYLLTSDDGSINASEIISTLPWTKHDRIDVTMYRGNYTILKGNDGRTYKIIVYSYTFFPIQIED